MNQWGHFVRDGLLGATAVDLNIQQKACLQCKQLIAMQPSGRGSRYASQLGQVTLSSSATQSKARPPSKKQALSGAR